MQDNEQTSKENEFLYLHNSSRTDLADNTMSWDHLAACSRTIYIDYTDVSKGMTVN